MQQLGVVSASQLEQVKQQIQASGERVSAILVARGFMRDLQAGMRLAAQLGVVLQRIELPARLPQEISKLPLSVWQVHRVVPIQAIGSTLLAATDDPLSVFALESLGRRAEMSLEAVLIGQEPMNQLLALLNSQELPMQPPLAASSTMQRAPLLPAKPSPPGSPASAAKPVVSAAAAAAFPGKPAFQASAQPKADEPIIQLVDSIFNEAVRLRASDIHIQAGAQNLRVRYRIDGVLNDVNSPPKALHGSIISRIKILSSLNIAEKRLPQDGRMQIIVNQRPLDIRVSTLPASYGEAAVLRLLDRSQPIRGVSEMGMNTEDQKRWEELVHCPHGMVLVTGPTGSGKTTTLYSALSVLNKADRKLITVEDPVEYQLSGVNQVSVKSTIGLTFAAGLRAMLRQAPDVIMVGEIRDPETAQIAIQAALTGHLVLSTLHTNDAPTAVTRLIDMGIAPFLIASTLQGVLAQRLVRRICSSCRLTDYASVDEKSFLGEPEVAQVIRSVGCDVCHSSGFLGRIGIFELLVMDEPIRRLIVEKATASAIRDTAVKAGMRGLREDGKIKIREGLTTMSEVLRVVVGDDDEP